MNNEGTSMIDLAALKQMINDDEQWRDDYNSLGCKEANDGPWLTMWWWLR